MKTTKDLEDMKKIPCPLFGSKYDFFIEKLTNDYAGKLDPFVLPWDDDGQTVFFTDTVAGAADIMIASLVGMVVLVIREAGRIENQVVMDMPLVNVGGQYKFILTAKDLVRKLHPDLMGFLWRDLPRGEGLYQVAAQVIVIAPVNGMVTCPSKFNICGLCGAAIGGDQQLFVRLGGIADIVNGSL